MTDEERTVERRLDALERSNRIWRRAAAAGGLAALALLLLGAARPKPRTVEAGEIRLLDEKGTLRASLSAGKTGTSFFLADEKGTVRARLALDAGAPRLELSDSSGKPMASLAVRPDGEAQLTVGAEKQPRAAVRVGTDGAPELFLTDAEDRPRADLALHPDGTPRLAMFDDAGSLRMSLGSTPLKEKRSGASVMTEPSNLVLLNDKGEVVFKAPK